jgi:hypothetical protein
MEVDTNDPKAVAEMMSRFCNVMTHNKEEFVKAMGYEHRTLQQCFTNLCFAWIRECAKKKEDGLFDARNEWSCKVSKQIVDAVEDVAYDGAFI